MKLLKLFIVVFLQIYGLTCNRSPSIVIVGAGPSGIAAATKLLEHNYTNIWILEAENRIGGRIHSVFFGDAYIDLGAEMCHGTKDNVVYEMVKDFNILRHEEMPNTVYFSSRKDINKEFADEIITIIFSIYDPDGHRDEIEGKTLGYYCIKKYNSTIHAKYEKQPDKLEVAKSSLDLLQHVALDFEGAFNWFDPSANSDYTDCEGDQRLKWNGLGYKTALEILMKKFPDPSKGLPVDQTVLLNKEVVQVLWNQSSSQNGVTVVCSDNTSFVADHVIFTPSVGVLKHSHKKIFVPPLPTEKSDAIKNIGIGAVMKVAMYFNDRWWKEEKNFTGFYLVWNDKDKNQVLKEFPEGPLKESRSWLTDVYAIYAEEKNPNVLIGWMTGTLVPEIEKMSNETLIHGFEFLFNKFLGHKYNTTGPNEIIKTSWYNNPHFRGCYSYQTPNARRNKITAEIELSKPLLNHNGRPILQFAGEATHPYFYSTVHGAIETGFREADRIINLYT